MSEIKGRYRIKWIYIHHLNSRSSTVITKKGEYFGKIKHTYKHWDKGGEQMALVHFDGNKRSSVVPFSELKIIKTK